MDGQRENERKFAILPTIMMEQGNELCTWRTNRSPFFSVIVPVYNVAPYLGECLDSVLAQTFADWECLCTDDGSKDGSDLILDAYARRDPRFRIVHQPNVGVSAARNRALDRARGRYVTFVDADDVIAPERYALVASAIREGNPDLVALRGEHYFVDGTCPAYREPTENCKSETFETDEAVMRFFASRTLSSANTFVYKHTLVKGTRFVPWVNVGEDTMFVWEALPVVRTVIICDYSGYYYRQRPGSALHTPHLRKTVTGFAARSRQIVCLARTMRRQGNPRWVCPIFVYSTFLCRLAGWVCRRRRGGVSFAIAPAFARYLAHLQHRKSLADLLGLSWRLALCHAAALAFTTADAFFGGTVFGNASSKSRKKD